MIMKCFVLMKLEIETKKNSRRWKPGPRRPMGPDEAEQENPGNRKRLANLEWKRN